MPENLPPDNSPSHTHPRGSNTVRSRSEQEFRTLAENIPDMIIRFDAQLRPSYLNPAVKKELGSPADFSGWPLDLVQWVFDTGEEVEFEFSHNTLGGLKYFQAHGVPERLLDGTLVSALFIHRDITERKQDEELLRLQRNLNITLSSTSSMPGALAAVLETVCQIDAIDSGRIYLVDPHSGALELAAQYGFSDDFAQQVRQWEPQAFEAALTRAGQPVYSTFDKLPEPHLFAAQGLQALAVLPIIYEGKTTASLNLSSHQHPEIPAYIRTTLETIAARLGGTLARIRYEDALRQSEERYRQLVDASPIGVIVHRDHQILFANPASAAILGAACPAELVGRSLLDLTHPDFREAILQHQAEARFTRLDGQVIDIETSGSLFDFEGAPANQMVLHDITDHKQAEAVLAEQVAFEKLLSELSGQVANAARDTIDSVIQDGLRRITEFLSVDRATLHEFDPAGNNYVIRQEYARAGIMRSMHLVQAGAQEAGETLNEAAQALEFLQKHGVSSYVDVPVQMGGNLLGKIELTSYQYQHVWPPELVARIRMVAEFFLNGLARARAEEAEHNQRMLAEALRESAAVLNSRLDLNQVLDGILSNVERVVPYDTVDIMLLENGVARIVREKGYTEHLPLDAPRHMLALYDTPMLRRMQRTALPVLVPDTDQEPEWFPMPTTAWVRSYAGAPIISDGQVIGFINLGSEVPNYYQTQHIDRLRAFVDQAAVAFTNARLVSELRKANDRLHAQLSEIQTLQEELRDQAIRDPLTGLFNRRYLQVTLEREIARAHREMIPIGVIEMDVDHFKQVNDNYGHFAGDEILKALGHLLITHIRQQDIACRFGGEEFVVVLPGTPLAVARQRAELIRAAFSALRVTCGDQRLRATLSVGVAIFPLHGRTTEELLVTADQAMYQAKQNGRDRVFTAQ